MPRIQLLEKNVAELIAAGEVVERPASVVKELVENSVDAGATAVTVEIKQGGITYLRVTDNGSGIDARDVPVAFKRHATSKIRIATDLDSISTLGFRGEALAAISSVARVELLTATKGAVTGTRYCIEGGQETCFEEAGCPTGTTIIVRDIFYNTPARMKFLKKDVTEANTVAAIMERMALSHPEVSFKLIRDGKLTLNTSGDKKLESAVYSVLGREFSSSLIPVNGETDRVMVQGLTCRPVSCKSSRNGQYFFLNGRYIKSATITAALEQAYKNTVMVGKFPAAVLNVTVPLDSVDVNVHPAKTEVRFSDERRVFSAVYYAVKNALTAGDTRPDMQIKSANDTFNRMTAAQYRQTVLHNETYSSKSQTVSKGQQLVFNDFMNSVNQTVNDVPLQQVKEISVPQSTPVIIEKQVSLSEAAPVQEDKPEIKAVAPDSNIEVQKNQEEISEQRQVRYVGEAFKTYILAEMEGELYFIDKHAAHERINFEQLKKSSVIQVQPLLAPQAVTLTGADYSAIIDNMEMISAAGFEIEDFGNMSVIVSAVPAMLTKCDIAELVNELAATVSQSGTATLQVLDRIFHTVACKAAIKAGNTNDRYELERLAARVLNNRDIMYCPHGRPVAIKLTEREIEKQFGRIQ